KSWTSMRSTPVDRARLMPSPHFIDLPHCQDLLSPGGDEWQRAKPAMLRSGGMPVELDRDDEWYESEESTRIAMVDELQRIRRRARSRPDHHRYRLRAPPEGRPGPRGEDRGAPHEPRRAGRSARRDTRRETARTRKRAPRSERGPRPGTHARSRRRRASPEER